MKKSIYLMRHGQDDDGFIGGWTPNGLTTAGKVEIKAIAEQLSETLPVSQIFTSDLRRAVETAEIVASTFGLPLTLLPAFRETNNGDLAGLTTEEFQRCYPGLYWRCLAMDEPYPNGESPNQFFSRVSEAWEEFKKEAPNNSLLVTHGGVINAIRCLEAALPLSNQVTLFPTRHGEVVTISIER